MGLLILVAVLCEGFVLLRNTELELSGCQQADSNCWALAMLGVVDHKAMLRSHSHSYASGYAEFCAAKMK